MAENKDPIGAAKSLIDRRPAETATLAAGALGLLLSGLAEGSTDELRTALVVLLAALPAVVSYVYDLGRPKGGHDLGREVEELALRAARRARLGHDGWNVDVDAATQLAELRKSLDPKLTAGKAGKSTSEPGG